MGFLNRLRVAPQQPVMRPIGSGPIALHNSVMAKPAPCEVRQSNGLKDFLRELDGIRKGMLLDMGPAWQNTLTFFIERGFKVYSEDVLTAWRDARRAEEERLKKLQQGAEPGDVSPGARAERFLNENLRYDGEKFDAVLAWDLLDYMEPKAAAKMVERLGDLVCPGGVILAVFHVRKPESFQRYRVHDAQSVELVPTPQLVPPQQVLQNREIQNLFGSFHSSRTFVGRDQIREGVFIR
jgi:cyclopropane fatty-acyl-phospholipid synthase-like methyltransferase